MPTCYNVKKGPLAERKDMFNRDIPNFSLVIGFRDYGKWIDQRIGLFYYDKIIFEGGSGINLYYVDRLYLIENPSEQELQVKMNIINLIKMRQEIKPLSAKNHTPGHIYVMGNDNAQAYVKNGGAWPGVMYIYLGRMKKYIYRRGSYYNNEIDNPYVYMSLDDFRRFFMNDIGAGSSEIISYIKNNKGAFYDVNTLNINNRFPLDVYKTKKKFYYEIPDISVNIGLSTDELRVTNNNNSVFLLLEK